MTTIRDPRAEEVLSSDDATAPVAGDDGVIDHRVTSAREWPEVLSVWDLLAILWARRVPIVAVTLMGALIALAPALLRAPTFTSEASFVLSGTDQTRSALAGLAGQLGVAMPNANSTTSPQLYADLVKSRAILAPVVDAAFRTTPVAAPRPLVDLLGAQGTSAAVRRDDAIRILEKRAIDVRVNKGTGLITLLVTTRWPLVSRDVAQRILATMNDFTIRMRREQAAAERVFSDERLAAARDSLRVAENRLQSFMSANREWRNSPDLSFEHDRLQRIVGLQEQIFGVAAQSAEEARGREVRNTPLLSVLDVPNVPSSRNSLGRARALVVGGFIGALLSTLWVLLAFELRRHRALARARAGRGASVTGRAARRAQRGIAAGDAPR